MRLDFLAALSGILIALQARANGELSHQLGNGLEAALVSFGSGLIIIVLISFFNPSIKEGIRNLREAVQEKKIARWRENLSSNVPTNGPTTEYGSNTTAKATAAFTALACRSGEKRTKEASAL
jgi:predicted PurR-regulated permease PerM